MIKNKKAYSNNNLDKISVPIGLVSAQLSEYPQLIYTFFYILSAYLVLPIFDIPLLGLSISAPIMFIVAVACVLKPLRPWFHAYRQWIFLAILIWVGVFFSTVLNGIVSFGLKIDSGGVATIIRYAYWLLVFVITSYFVSRGEIMPRLSGLLGWSVFLLAVLRLGEALIFGRYGNFSQPRLLSQNNYGMQFSTFSPFLLIMVFQQRGWKRLLAIIANLLLWGAVAVNGSRGSWVSILIGLGICLAMFFFSKPRKLFGLVFLLFLVLALTFVTVNIFPEISVVVNNRFQSFQTLEEDKSVLIRELMVQKGLLLFEESPLIGVGGNRFRQSSASLEIPLGLSYETEAYFNRRSSHNSYIEFLAEFGLLGAIPYGLLLIILVVQGTKVTLVALRQNDVIPLAVLLSLIQMSTHLWAISALANTATWFVYGLIGAVIMSYRKIKV